VWVYNFQAPKIQAAFFCESNDITGGRNRIVDGSGQYRSINGVQRRLKVRGPIWGHTGPFLCLRHSKLKIKDLGQSFVAYPAI